MSRHFHFIYVVFLFFIFDTNDALCFYSKKNRTTPMSMGLQVKLRIVGRKNGNEKWLEDAYKTYETRLKPTIAVDTVWHKNDDDMSKAVQKDKSKGHTIVLLVSICDFRAIQFHFTKYSTTHNIIPLSSSYQDPNGKSSTSEIFSDELYQWLDSGGSRVSFVIGGSQGLPLELKEKKANTAPYLLRSLSELTFTHLFARTILIEQIYRASEIRKGSDYHK